MSNSEHWSFQQKCQPTRFSDYSEASYSVIGRQPLGWRDGRLRQRHERSGGHSGDGLSGATAMNTSSAASLFHTATKNMAKNNMGI